jgi:hypothetical protein
MDVLVLTGGRQPATTVAVNDSTLPGAASAVQKSAKLLSNHFNKTR